MRTNSPSLILAIFLLLISAGPIACASTASPVPSSPVISSPSPTGATGLTTRPGEGAIVLSDSIVTAKIVAVRALTTGYPWEMDVLVQNSVDVDTLPNPTKDKVGQVITVKTDEKLNAFKVDDVITARIKYVGDVPRPGITLYIYNIQPK